jgi:hypothetical protein
MSMSERSEHQEPTQLRLLAGGSRRRDWMLDERTRLLGREGVKQAREILRQARPPEPKIPAPVRKAS